MNSITLDPEQACEGESSLPDNVATKADLEIVPREYLNEEDERRPIKYSDKNGSTYTYALKPMLYSVIFILIVECLERFSYYGIDFTQTAFLTGVYNANWNANLTAAEASSMTSLSVAIAYSSPFLGAALADGLLGEFWNIIIGTSVLYIPGIVLIALTTIPYLLGPTFNISVLSAGLFVLFPLGTGFIKSCVNVFGAKQFHPILQSAMIERYYVNFYLVINIGALVGGLLIPVIAQFNVTAAYFIPAGTMATALVAFLSGASRYVRTKPDKTVLVQSLDVIGRSVNCTPKMGIEKSKESNGGKYPDAFVTGVKQLLYVIPISALTIPFQVVYAQMATTFIVQGTVMKPAGIIDASMMQNADAVSVLIFGVLIGQFLYPAMEKRGIHLAATHKFAIGTFFAMMAVICALIVEYQIHAHYAATGESISVLWQFFSFFFVGAGEIFAVSAAYEAAFVVAPKEQKALASAINLFLGGGLPNFLCMALDSATKSWFETPDGSGNITTLAAYSETSVEKFWYTLIGIAIGGIILNLLPPVKRWVDGAIGTAKDNLVQGQDEAIASKLSIASCSL